MDGIDNLFDIFDDNSALVTTTTAPTQPQHIKKTDESVIPQAAQKRSSPAITQTESTTATSKPKLGSQDSKDADRVVQLTKTEPTDPSTTLVTTTANDESSTTALNVLPSTGPQKSSTELAIEDYDVFNGFYEQVVVGSEKPENVTDQTQKTCAMQTCYPPLFNHHEYERNANDAYRAKISDSKYQPAKQYPFTLDPFQAKAVECIEKNQSVLVAAHTSAGKTVCAEYAIAKSLKLGQRVIYTSPIKALSNQKYRELQAEFTDVGLMTGDVTINAGASCLVMTTEILRNMLYRGSEVLREISWVIFDEVHYMRDRSRGVVWEETIILLPHKCRFVFLSATLLNSAEFASWVAKVHNQPCSVIYTNYRPTPLEHYVCGRGSDGIHVIVDKHGEFKEGNFQKAISALSDSGVQSGPKDPKDSAGGLGADKGKKKARAGVTSEDEVEIIVRKVKELELDPCIVFSFSKKDCERFAKNMMKIDFCTDDERALISEIYTRAINGLTEQDRKLPQVQELAPLLKQGIGIHHGGLLPILKEVVELLFQEGLLRVLFSTETFSIGLNMPARTVVFTSMFKWDGMQHRALTSGEYIQMSGRAGRRGLDDKGVVILMLNQEVETNVVKAMMAGPSDPLMSSFKLGYNMLLNLTRLEEAKPDHLMLRSFYQFQQQRAVPMLATAITAVESQRQEKIEEIKEVVSKQNVLTQQAIQQFTLLNNQSSKQTTINPFKQTTKASKAAKPDQLPPHPFPVIQIEDIQHYHALYQNLFDQRQILRTLLHRPEFLRPVLNNSLGQIVHIKACIREGPPPLHGSAAELALLEAYNQPLVVNNNDVNFTPLEFSVVTKEAFGLLRANRGIIDGDNAAQSANSAASSTALVRQDDLTTETGLVPPGMGFSQFRLAQLAQSNKANFLEIQRRRLKDKEMNFGWGVVLNATKRSLPDAVLFGAHTPIPAATAYGSERNSTGTEANTKRQNKEKVNSNSNSTKDNAKDVTIFDVLLAVDPDTVSEKQELLQTTSSSFLGSAYALHLQTRPCPSHKKPKFIIVPILASAINAVSGITMPDYSHKTGKERTSTGDRLVEIQRRCTSIVIADLQKKEKQNATTTDTAMTSASTTIQSNLPILDPIPSLTYTDYDPNKSGKKTAQFPLIDTPLPLINLFDKLQFFNAANSKPINTKKDSKNNNSDDGNDSELNSDLVKDIVALNYRISRLHQQLSTLKLHHHPLKSRFLSLYQHKITLDGFKVWLNYKMARVSKDKTLESTLIAMNRVLRNLQLITQEDVITNKGRVACEVSTCDELVGTELLYSSIFNALNVKQLASLCSCLVFDEGSAANDDQKPKFTEGLETPYNQLEEHLKHIATVIKEASIPININEYVRSFNPFLMNLVHEWCEGASFATIMKNTKGKVFEGTVVRVMRRLEELMRQFATASATLGNTELEEKFNLSIQRLKRDIVFAASLYL